MERIGCTLPTMRLQYIKMAMATVWVFGTLLVGVVAQMTSAAGLIVLAAVSLLPPLAMLLLWNDPQQTMSESIREGRR